VVATPTTRLFLKSEIASELPMRFAYHSNVIACGKMRGGLTNSSALGFSEESTIQSSGNPTKTTSTSVTA